MRSALLAALAAIGIPVATGAATGCSLVAGYESLHLAPDAADSPNVGDAGVLPALDPSSAIVYSAYPTIFSPMGDLAGVTAQLERIHELGFNVLSLMPVTPIGQATGGHPSYQSPYCVHDYYAINASYGSPLDLGTLVGQAHALGIYVILDEELNHTAWDNPLIEQHPEFYLHSDGNPENVASIEQAFTFADVAQLDYDTTPSGLQAYMTTMLEYWLTTYGVDGFRFLTAEAPPPPGTPTIPASFWQQLHASLVTVKSDVVMWADEEDPALGGDPFELDYGWTLRGGEANASGGAGLLQVTNGAPASELQQAWQAQTTGFSGVHHVALLQNWDIGPDLQVYGGLAGTMAAATFDFTIDGVPMLWNGEEVGSESNAPDTQAPIDWSGPDAATLTSFYSSLVGLRRSHTTLQGGTLAWVSNSAASQVASFTRSDAGGTFLVAINFSSSAATGTFTLGGAASGWSDVSPVGSPGGMSHALPPAFSLAPYDFAVFSASAN